MSAPNPISGAGGPGLSRPAGFGLGGRARSLVAVRAAAAVVLALGVSACASTPEPLTLQPSAAADGADYAGVLERWSRSDEVFDGLFSVMFVHATLHAPELRKAFLRRFPDTYGRGSDEANRLTLADPSAESHWAFFLSASTPNQRWNDLARPDSIWRVSLQADDGPKVDAKVRRIDLNANLRRFYPYLTPFASGYGLEFPLTVVEGGPLIGPDTRRLVLRVSSALGEAEMTWDFRPSARVTDARARSATHPDG